MSTLCAVDGCERPGVSRGWCTKHYQRWKRNGDPTALLSTYGVPAEDRFWAKVNKDGPISEYAPELGHCWIWKSDTVASYPRVWVAGRAIGIHVLSLLIAGVEIPNGYVVDHLCRVTHCVNPAHLEPVTNGENVLRGIGRSAENARKSHCIRNHEFTPENTYIAKNGSRHCWTCIYERTRAWRAARSVA